MKMERGLRESSLRPIQMARKHTTMKKAGRRHRRSRTAKRGGGYSFGGSLLSDAGGPNAGNAQWNNHMGSDCGADLQGRGGNNQAGGRRRHRKTVAGRRRRSRRGGSLALQQPRTGYTFNGSGVAGTADTVAVGSPVVVV
jgi:hypothetical protein